MTLAKSFIITAVLYLPKAFVNGGWLFTPIMLVISAVVTYFCGVFLLELRQKLDCANYPEIG
jgi:proton-coupled amino acid transporter